MSDEALGITLRGNAELALQYVPQARRLVYRLREQMKWGSKVQGAHERLSDRAYVYAYAMPGMTRAVIVADYDEQDQDLHPVEATKTPDFVSGVVAGGRIVGEVPVLDRFRPTAAAAALHRMPERYALSARFALRPHPDVPTLDDPDQFPPLSQYARGKATQWTGAMRIVIQAISAIGKAEAPSIYDRVPPAVLNPQRPDAEPSAYEAALPQQGVRIRYGHTRERTHGITFGADGRPWLVEISITRGVLAMPLPLFEATTLPRFRQRLVTINDEAGLDLLDQFGGFPSGEILPVSTDALESAIRGGFVLRLQTPAALSGFYAHNSYSPDNGWAFSATGHDAVTTVWRTGEDDIQRGSWWGVGITIGATLASTGIDVRALQATLSRVAADEAAAWTLRKLERMPIEHVRIIANLAREAPARAYEELDAVVLPPMASATARVSKRGEGYLWAPRTAIRHPPIAYHNSMLGYCITHDPRPRIASQRPAGIIDTVMWVAYHGQELVWVRYFDDPRSAPSQVNDDREECMYIGQWEYSIKGAPVAPRNAFYTTHVDEREDSAGTEVTTLRQSADLGYTSVSISDDAVLPQWGALSRQRGFRVITTTTVINGPIVRTSIAFPGFDRSAYYYARAKEHSGKTVLVSRNNEFLSDPYIYQTWRNFPGYTGFYSHGLFIRQQHPTGCGPVDARTVNQEARTESRCSEFADSGPWASVCQNADGMVYSSSLPPSYATITSIPPTSNLAVHLYYEGGELLVLRDEAQAPRKIDESWFITSPDPLTLEKIWLKSWHNCWGDGLALMYMSTAGISEPEQRHIHGVPAHAEMWDALARNETYTLIGRID